MIFSSIDNYLNRTTMYRLVLYYLTGLWLAAIILSALGILHYSPLALFASAMLIITICWITNTIFAKVFEAPTNIESVYITAYILVLIITPPKTLIDMQYLPLACWASIIAMASKYIFAIGKKHIFNPAAFAVALTAFTIDRSASWWVGTASMAPLVLIGGLLIVRKIRRSDMVIAFFVISISMILIFNVLAGSAPDIILKKTLLDSPLLFFAFVMLTEPLTTPATNTRQALYGGLNGLLFAPQIHLGIIYSTPELALLVSNIFSYIVSPKEKLMLRLKEKIEVARDTYDFVYTSDKSMKFTPGQYVECTLEHAKPDMRGNRRYFTIASSPTEENFRLGIKYYPKSSTFKNTLFTIPPDSTMTVGQLAGDFTLPKDPARKLVFIAGGIGVTPFRSMIKYLIDRNEKRDIILFYSNKTPEDVAYKNLFDEAEKKLGIKVIYMLTNVDCAPQDWSCKLGYIDKQTILDEVPDFTERTFYLSGPHGMVSAFEQSLKTLNLPDNQIKIDFFPGFA